MPNLQDRVLETLSAHREDKKGMTCRDVRDALGGDTTLPPINLMMSQLLKKGQVRKSYRKNDKDEWVWFFQEDTRYMNKVVLDWWNMIVELNNGDKNV